MGPSAEPTKRWAATRRALAQAVAQIDAVRPGR